MINRRSFFGFLPAPWLGLGVNKVADPATLMIPAQAVRMLTTVADFSVFQKLFPAGIVVTEGNVKALLKGGWSLNQVISSGIPLTGNFEEDGTQRWYRDGRLHRLDGPAVTHADGTRRWYQDGVRHRDGGPAVIEVDGTQHWYRDGKIHRDGGPAVIYANGTQRWVQDNTTHRDGGPAVINANGTQHWYRDGKIHRDDGPAITYADGSQEWWQNGERHRDDGPARVADGVQYWYQNGKCTNYIPRGGSTAVPANHY